MSEEILKIELIELMKTVRLKRPNGTVIEAHDIEALRDCCAEIRNVDPHASEILFKFFNLAAQITEKSFPVKVEFAIAIDD